MKLSYQGKIRLAKIILMFLIILITLMFILVPTVYMHFKNNYSFASNILSTLLKSDIKPPVLSGTTKSGGAYHLTAKKVVNNLLTLNLKIKQDIIIIEPILMYTSNNNLIFSVKAKEATLNTGTHIVKIPGLINIKSNHNHIATLQDTTINLKTESLQSDKKLTGSYNNKILQSNGILINNSGNIVIFKGPVIIKTVKKN